MVLAGERQWQEGAAVLPLAAELGLAGLAVCCPSHLPTRGAPTGPGSPWAGLGKAGWVVGIAMPQRGAALSMGQQP